MSKIFWIVFFLFASNIYCQEKISKLYSLAKVYGYVRYFYPGSELDSLDWDRYLVHSLKNMEGHKNQGLAQKMELTFAGIAPAARFSNVPIQLSLVENEVYPSDTLVFKRKFLRNKAKQKYSLGIKDNDIINKHLKVGESIYTKITEGLYFYMPLVLYANEFGTYPQPKSIDIKELRKRLEIIQISDSSIHNRLAGVIITWNTIQHFYSYRDVLPNDWDGVLIKYLTACYQVKNTDDYMKLLNSLLSLINDGHAFAYLKNGPISYFPSFKCKYINDSLIVSYAHDSLKGKIEKGDNILLVDGIKIEHLMKQKRDETSAATKSYSNYLAANSILRSNKNRWLNLQVQKPSGKIIKVDIYRGLRYMEYSSQIINPNPKSLLINDSTFYINFNNASYASIDSLLPVLLNKNIICDLRGYPNNNDGFIRHLLKMDDTVAHHFKIPNVLYPDFKQVNYKPVGWQLKKKEPHLTGKIVFLIDCSIISYGESFMALAEHYRLGTIIGEHTAGTNGNMARTDLPVSGISFAYTGMLVTKPNGSRLHGIGILPNIEVQPTVNGIKNKKDEILEKAIEFLTTPKSK
jgi:C-terminal processing protease CtpA/Prc